MAADLFPTFSDERGTLTTVEFADVPFAVQRAFVVSGAHERLPRGDHEVPCEELLVLLTGSMDFRVSVAAAADRTGTLSERGDSLHVRPGSHLVYVLDGPDSSILVLASEPYRSDWSR